MMLPSKSWETLKFEAQIQKTQLLECANRKQYIHVEPALWGHLKKHIYIYIEYMTIFPSLLGLFFDVSKSSLYCRVQYIYRRQIIQLFVGDVIFLDQKAAYIICRSIYN